MDHNLEDSLNLETAMGVDFDHGGDEVVSQADITLDSSSHEGSIPMEFEHIEEQPILMDTNEEIIDLMGEQFTLQEYSEQTSEAVAITESNQQNILTSQAETMIDLQFDPQSISSTAIGQVQSQPKIIAVKAALPPMRLAASNKKNASLVLTPAPRQVAIAPKPAPKTMQNAVQKPTFTTGKQFAIAPKPVTLVANRSTSIVKKVSLAGVVQGNVKTNTVLAQIGKQLVMVPAGGSQKIKLVTSTSVPTLQYIRADSEQAQLIATKNVTGSQTGKPVMTKLIVQGQPNLEVSNQPAVITKILPAGSTASSHTRYVTMQQKTVPISTGNKVLVTSPAKQGMKIAKKQQIVTLKSPTPELLPAPSQGPTTKKVVITANPSTQNVVLKTTAPSKTTQVVKEGSVVSSQAQRTQLHQINVPGKGIQYIRLITNSSPVTAVKATPATKPQPPVLAVPSKTIVLTDNKGNLIQMTAEKMVSGQPPPLVMTGTAGTINKLTAKPQQKLVRIAPVVSKTSQLITQQSSTRSAQSLLAPLSPMEETSATLEEVTEPEVCSGQAPEDETDSKAALRALIADTMADETNVQGLYVQTQEVEVEFERGQSSTEDQEDTNSMDQHDSSTRSDEHPLIVIPSNYLKPQDHSDLSKHDESKRMMNVDAEILNSYQSPRTPQALSETDLVSNELGLRPRKACNCTKSQCLKLYCDCFANGEFCNRCNCNNCHNNLENEELRQKAIRGCLDRNPNAFRPKIGKAKSGGPEIVRRHNKGCNCKRSGCLKNYCECYEAKIACTSICKCVGCRNVEETLERARRRDAALARDARDAPYRPPPPHHAHAKQPCSFMTTEVIEAVCQCLIAAAVESSAGGGAGECDGDERAGAGPEPACAGPPAPADPVRDVLEEFARCLQDIINAAHQATPVSMIEEGSA